MKLPTTFQEIGDFRRFGLEAVLPPPDAPVWDVWTFRQRKHAVHRQTRSIAFQWLDRPWQPGTAPQLRLEEYADAPLRHAVAGCVDALERHFGGKALRVMLAELSPGGEIAPHVDQGPGLTLSHRCHIPVRTNAAVEFWIDQQIHQFREGIAYEIDNTRLHAVINRGTTPRVHLICDVLDPGNADGPA